MKFNKIIPSILCAAIICTSFIACSPGKKPKIRSAEFSLTAEAETANVELNGDYAKIDFINPGLDTADISVSVFSLAEQKEFARVALGNGTWSTGSLENGFLRWMNGINPSAFSGLTVKRHSVPKYRPMPSFLPLHM